MKKLLTILHWQIFLLIFGMPLIFFCALNFTDNWDPLMVYSPLVMIVCFSLLLTWLYTLATNLQTKLLDPEPFQIKNFKIVFFINIAYMIVMLLAMAGFVTFDYTEWELPLDVISQGSYIYMVWYISKQLKTAELLREAQFSEYVATVFLLWLAPIGIWSIQERINKVFEKIENDDVSLTLDGD